MFKSFIASTMRALLPPKQFNQVRKNYQQASGKMVKQSLFVPGYVYSARVKDADVPWFEQQFYRNVDLFDPDVRETEDRFNYAVRIGYTFMLSLKLDALEKSPACIALKDKLITLGNKGFTWTHYADPLPSDATIYAFGAGTDISWEVAVAHHHKCTVHCFDPTPQAVTYAQGVADHEPLIAFAPIGVSSEDGEVEFFKPEEQGLGSHSMVNLRQSGTSIKVPVRKLSTLMRERGDTRIDLLKMDIEGAEYSVLDTLEASIEIDQIAVEFDQPVPPWRTEKLIRKLLGAGYQVAHVDGLNCLFVHDRILP